MSNSSDRPWTEEDKYTLLTEILKKAEMPSSHLINLIKDFNITPNWEHIPLPQGRSLSACKTAFLNMCQQAIHPPKHPAPFPRSDMTGPPAPDPMRKRPLYPSDKPLPRAIQPRPPASTASYSSESGASAQLSPTLDPGTGEPPRKRGRPSKAETERRKLAAEARGETYPPPRRSNSARLKITPSPTSPAAGPSTSFPQSIAPQAFGPKQGHIQAHGRSHSHSIGHVPSPMMYEASAMRSTVPPGPSINDERRDFPSRSMPGPSPAAVAGPGPNMRELPRPTEMGHHLPAPRILQLGPPDAFPRLSNPAERPYSSIASNDRYSPSDSDRRDSVTSRPDQHQPPYPEGRIGTPAEKPPR
ncbi:hypothetical protein N7499_012407 [Penicillium canescens]|uniref:Uncharacterized protein n=1 Tax=Penicillium canescens TaxID=5083 RepID=A0AAD6I3A3_PENCN|nr:uncharacterized protein N7446_000947 [Penicillium canescens]KAJ6012991.1 hypothetical protein N7522_003346 [Penicillium canescens]KAJ6029990.1 hypothetical protein N7460_010256 [Penicillium canescens]KAJ6060368.1 hypothetical protein N7444_002222 [Penicillium canescens]KAJ6063727.1 hypothetical protein N7499_012407 [Penicillium canescens]KAJ6078011.1 hypothetical protein N7446_000947 [Penicillium canescens]